MVQTNSIGDIQKDILKPKVRKICRV